MNDFQDEPIVDEREEALAKIKGPAIALIIVGVLGLLNALFGLAYSATGMQEKMLEDQRTQMEEQTRKLREDGQEEAARQIEEMQEMTQKFTGLFASPFWSAVGLFGSLLVLFGSIKMMKLQSRGLAMTASIVAMVPFLSPCCCLGLPFGIWALIVMNKDFVSEAFSA